MKSRDDISIRVIKRLPKYYRALINLENSGVKRVSSVELSKILGTTASQVRQDLNCFGGFGQQGLGYDTAHLKEEIGNIIGVDKTHNAILIGGGNLGKAVATRINFDSLGFRICAVFEKDERMISTMIRGMKVHSDNYLEEYLSQNDITAAFMCVPEQAAQTLCERLYFLGIRCFWNFSHYDISLHHSDVIVENIDLSDSLLTLCCRINNDLYN